VKQDKFVQFWSNRIGRDGAFLYWRAVKVKMWAASVGIVGWTLIIAGGYYKNTIALLLGAGSVIVALGLTIPYRVLRTNVVRTSALNLGVDPQDLFRVFRVLRFDAVYEKWCGQHGVAAYSADTLNPVSASAMDSDSVEPKDGKESTADSRRDMPPDLVYWIQKSFKLIIVGPSNEKSTKTSQLITVYYLLALLLVTGAIGIPVLTLGLLKSQLTATVVGSVIVLVALILGARLTQLIWTYKRRLS